MRKGLLRQIKGPVLQGKGEKMRNRADIGQTGGIAGFQSGLIGQINATGAKCKRKIN